MDLSPFVINTLVAFVLGTGIGLERQFGAHPAGLLAPTHWFALVRRYSSACRCCSPSRNCQPPPIAAQVVSGIGFLGGGVILREGMTVRGMNTAATLWCNAAIGSLAGAGFAGHAAVGARWFSAFI